MILSEELLQSFWLTFHLLSTARPMPHTGSTGQLDRRLGKPFYS
jgi:hypothetical protein